MAIEEILTKIRTLIPSIAISIRAYRWLRDKEGNAYVAYAFQETFNAFCTVIIFKVTPSGNPKEIYRTGFSGVYDRCMSDAIDKCVSEQDLLLSRIDKEEWTRLYTIMTSRLNQSYEYSHELGVPQMGGAYAEDAGIYGWDLD